MDKVLTGAELLVLGAVMLWALGGMLFVFFVLRALAGWIKGVCGNVD